MITPVLSARLHPYATNSAYCQTNPRKDINMRKQRIVAPPIGTMYRVSYYSQNHNNVVEYWQVERRTERTVWLRQLVTNTHDQPIPGMVRSDLELLERRVLPDGCLRIHEGVYVHSYADIYRPTN